VPVQSGGLATTAEPEGYHPAPNEAMEIEASMISPGYYRAIGTPLLRGREFTEADRKGSERVVIVNQAFAERFWPGQDPIGKRMRRGDSGPWRTVVGVVADTKQYEVDGEPPITAFYPNRQLGVGTRYLVIKAKADPRALVAPVTREVQALDADLPVYDVSTMEERLADSFARRRFSMFLLGVFAACASLLAAIGIYGVVSFWVSQRTRELGIRAALGARHHDIMRLVIGQVVVLVGIGIAAGLAAAFGLTRVMQRLLFGVSATDAVTYVMLAAALGVVALVASYVPARRAAGVPPIIALRAE
jgi:putative ABC transport system permease protein